MLFYCRLCRVGTFVICAHCSGVFFFPPTSTGAAFIDQVDYRCGRRVPIRLNRDTHSLPPHDAANRPACRSRSPSPPPSCLPARNHRHCRYRYYYYIVILSLLVLLLLFIFITIIITRYNLHCCMPSRRDVSAGVIIVCNEILILSYYTFSKISLLCIILRYLGLTVSPSPQFSSPATLGRPPVP